MENIKFTKTEKKVLAAVNPMVCIHAYENGRNEGGTYLSGRYCIPKRQTLALITAGQKILEAIREKVYASISPAYSVRWPSSDYGTVCVQDVSKWNGETDKFFTPTYGSGLYGGIAISNETGKPVGYVHVYVRDGEVTEVIKRLI